MTRREFDALKLQWARVQAFEHNVHFASDVRFTPEDFMDPSSRQRRIAEHDMNKLMVERENARLAQMRPNEIPEDLPDWAK